MIRLFFNIQGNHRKYSTKNYILEDGYYIFTDIYDGKPRKLSQEYYRGEEGERE